MPETGAGRMRLLDRYADADRRGTPAGACLYSDSRRTPPQSRRGGRSGLVRRPIAVSIERSFGRLRDHIGLSIASIQSGLL